MTRHDQLIACLRSALSERRWTQDDGAAAAGISTVTLRKILAGERCPTLKTLDKIAVGWQYEELFTDLRQEETVYCDKANK